MKLLYIDCHYGFDAQMLLGALIDAGASLSDIEESVRDDIDDFEIKAGVRTVLFAECVVAHTRGTIKETTADMRDIANPVVCSSVMSTLRCLGVDYVISSPIGIADGTDGEILSLIYNSGMEARPSDDGDITKEDVLFLSRISRESGPMPHMDIESVGYGSKEDTSDRLVTVYLGEYSGENFIKADEVTAVHTQIS